MKIIKYFKYLLIDIAEFLSLENYRFYRCFSGGIWYKHSMSGELLGCYGNFWARYNKLNRYTDVIKIENYEK